MINSKTIQNTDSVLDKFIASLEENKASPKDIAHVLADALYATDKHSEPDYASRIKASETILKTLKLLGPGESLTMNDIKVNVVFKNSPFEKEENCNENEVVEVKPQELISETPEK